MQKVHISLSPDLFSALEKIAADKRESVEAVAAHIISDSIRNRRHETVRILHPERGERYGLHESDPLHEIIKRQDAEITWLREQITRLSTLTTISHVIRHEYANTSQHHERDDFTDTDSSQPVLKEVSSPEETNPVPSVTVDDVQYTPSTGDNRGFDEYIPPGEGESRFSSHQRESDRTLRDSIGGVREEKDYSIGEAAAISGDTEEIILEYVIDGFLPAYKDGDSYLIRGNDLRRYMLSK